MVSARDLLGLNRKNRAKTPGTLDTQVPMTDDQVRAAWVAASWLIDYPSEALLEQLPNLDRLITGLPDRPRQGLAALISTLRTGDIVELRSDYVETFDTRRRECLFLTYFSHGDTRRRGMALLELKEQYRKAGLEVSDDELPDHLTYVLEFGAVYQLVEAEDILRCNLAGCDMMRINLVE